MTEPSSLTARTGGSPTCREQRADGADQDAGGADADDGGAGGEEGLEVRDGLLEAQVGRAVGAGGRVDEAARQAFAQAGGEARGPGSQAEDRDRCGHQAGRLRPAMINEK